MYGWWDSRFALSFLGFAFDAPMLQNRQIIVLYLMLHSLFATEQQPVSGQSNRIPIKFPSKLWILQLVEFMLHFFFPSKCLWM